MKDFDELKNIWHGQVESSTVSYDDVLKKVRASRLGFSNKLLIQLLVLGISIFGMTAALFLLPFQFGTSQAGIAIFILCCVLYLLIQWRDYRMISKSESLMTMPEEYIAYLKSYKQSRYILHTRVYRIYMLFIGIGLALYFIELFYTVSILQTVLAVVFTIAWFLVCYFVFLRLYIRKEEARLNEMIANLERLERQFSN